MVHLEQIKVKGKRYYRLVHTIRQNKKIGHKVKYIGKKLPGKKKLKQMKQDFLQEIKKKYHYCSTSEIELIEKRKLEYQHQLQSLSVLEREKKFTEFMIRFTYDSSKLSGVPITLRQTFLILQEKVIPENIKNLRTVRELENHQQGILVITKYKRELNLKLLKRLHAILLAGVDDSIAGKTRYELHRNVKLAGTSYVPPAWDVLSKELLSFFKWYNAEKNSLHPLELAAMVHLKLITLQAFVDGNSRLSRLLMNWILWKKKYPLIVIPIEDLERYYSVLDKYQIEKDERPFVEYIKQKFLELKG